MYVPFGALPLIGRCIAVIGSGGKTTLLRWLSERLEGSVILTTSTKIYPFAGMPLATSAREALDALRFSRVVCAGKPLPSGKLSAPDVPFEELLTMADAVLIEADGAAGRPLKAHRPWEPVIPACVDRTVCVVGASGLGRPAAEVCHCPELFCALAGISPDQPVDEAAIARALNQEALADVYFVNQIDALAEPARAARLCGMIEKPASMCALRIGDGR